MTPNVWRTLAVVLALIGSRASAQEPAACWPEPCGLEASSKMVQKTYPINFMLSFLGDRSMCDKFLTQTLTHVVKPGSWTGQGGSGTVQCVSEGEMLGLVVQQTPEVQMQVAWLLKSLEKMGHQQAAQHAKPGVTWAPAQPIAQASCKSAWAPAAYPACPCPVDKTAQTPSAKQFIHFVLDDLRFKMKDEGEFKIKRVEFQYKGDGIESDLAKAAMGVKACDCEDKVDKDVAKCLADVAKALGALSGGCGACGPCCPPPAVKEETKVNECHGCPKDEKPCDTKDQSGVKEKDKGCEGCEGCDEEAEETEHTGSTENFRFWLDFFH